MPVDPERIKAARASAKLTQQEMADAIGMKQQAYARLERTRYDCRLSTLEKIAAVAGIELTTLLGPAEASPKKPKRGGER